MTYPTVERLGKLADELELEALDPNMPEFIRVSLTRQAEKYRAAERAELEALERAREVDAPSPRLAELLSYVLIGVFGAVWVSGVVYLAYRLHF